MIQEEIKVKHLEFIQNIITRMNTNSFQLKELTITIVSALLAVYASSKKIGLIFIGILPIIIFWFLDAYYLQQERKFKGLYNDAAGITKTHKVKNFQMINEDMYLGGKYNYVNVLKSKTIMGFYLPILILTLVLSWIFY